MFRFIHAADLHLDSPLRGLDQYEGAPVDVLRGSTRAALKNLVNTAIQHRVRFVLLAGDLFDGNWHDTNTGLFFVGQMRRLREKQIRVYVIRGNHDAANRMTRSLPYPSNVFVFSAEQVQSLDVPDVPAMIHGQSYSTQEMTDNLAIRYPRARAGYFNIGLLHTALEGREGHENYAPCTLEQLRSREYHYWALGHIHQREVVSEGSGGYVIFPGNTQGRHIRETGAKGCYLVHVDANYDCTLEFVPLDSVRWCRLEVDCTGVQTPLQLLGRIQEHLTDACRAAQGRLLATRIVLRGSCPLHYALLAEVRDLRDKFRAIDLDAVERNPWIEQVEVRTRPPRQAEQDEPYADDASAALAGVMARLRADPASLDAMFDLEDLQHLLGQVPAGRGRKLETPASTDPQVRVALLERAHAWLLKQIAKPEKQP